jgi:hypothetical protein
MGANLTVRWVRSAHVIVLLVCVFTFFCITGLHHNLPRIVSHLVVSITLRNPADGSEITVPFLVNGGNEAVAVLLHHTDVAPLNLSNTGSLRAQMADRSACELTATSSVEVTLTLTDNTTVSAVLPAAYFPPSPPLQPDEVTVVANYKRILGYDALKLLGVKQDYKARSLVRTQWRI